MHLSTVEQELSDAAPVGILFNDVAVMLGLDELFWLDHGVALQDIQCCQFPLDCLPVRVVCGRGVRPGHQMIVAELVAHVVCLANAVCATELELVHLLARGFAEWVGEPVFALLKLFTLYQMLENLRLLLRGRHPRLHTRTSFPLALRNADTGWLSRGWTQRVRWHCGAARFLGCKLLVHVVRRLSFCNLIVVHSSMRSLTI